ncbi:MAG: site-specific integrase, partial [Synergistaceae bacterium]|nr:site-specific integrase [Synergistaceae bacterium]
MATVQKRKDSYFISVSCGYDNSGRQIRQTTTWRPDAGMSEKQTQKELARQVAQFEELCRSRRSTDGNMRFADFAEHWFALYAQERLRPKTLALYRYLLPRINAAIGHIKLENLRPVHLMQFYKNLAEPDARICKYRLKTDLKARGKMREKTLTAIARDAGLREGTVAGIAGGKNAARLTAEKISAALGLNVSDLFEPLRKPLSATTINKHHRLINTILETAVQWQIISSNPGDHVKAPASERKPPRYLDEIEAARLLQLLENEPIQYRTMIYLLLYAGLRRGELLGLEWSDIDIERRTIQVRQSSQYLPGRGVFVDKPKTDTSVRNIRISDDAAETLRKYRAWSAERQLMAGDRWNKSGYVFVKTDGTLFRPDTLAAWFRKFVRKNNLPDISPHSLRHTNATLQIAAGIPLPSVADRLGHATPQVTAQVYAHALKSTTDAAAEALQNILNEAKNDRGSTGSG